MAPSQRPPPPPPATQAEAYANAHAHPPHLPHPPLRKEPKKPLLQWLSSKLGGRNGRRATIPGEASPRGNPLEPTTSHQRRQKNNPYPSIPVQRRTSTVESSFFSRSDSELSRQTEVDDNASTRPIPPSHPASPSPSNALSRTASNSASASLLSPKPPKRNSASTASLSTKSTKPTTTMSFDSGPHIGYIAQTPTMGSPAAHMLHHNNPHPLASPDPNASTLTLASSRRPLGPGMTASPSVTWAPDTGDRSSLNGAPSGNYAPSGISMKPQKPDKDASVRAVRRRASWASDETNLSKFSWKPIESRANEVGVVG